MMSNGIRNRLVVTPKQLMAGIHIGLLCVMLVLKVLRAFSGATSTGGVWNIIQMFFIASGLLMSIRYARVHVRQAPVAVFILFGLVTLAIAAVKPMDFKASQLFNLVTIPYGPMMLVWVYYLSLDRGLKHLHRYVYWTYYILAALTILAMVSYRSGASGRGAVADVYYVVALLPFVLYHIRKSRNGALLRRSVRQARTARYSVNWRIFVPVLVAAAATMMTGKRAGMLAIAAMFLVYFLIVFWQQRDARKQLWLVILFFGLTLMGLLALQMLDERYGLNVVERLLKLAEDGGSNRDVLWAARLQALAEASPMQLLFGYDSNPFRGHAHNDFLELAVLYGVFPVILYVGYFVALVRVLLRMRRMGYPYTAEFSTAIVSALFLSMFSFFVIDPTYITSHAFSTGVILADFRDYTKYGGRLK